MRNSFKALGAIVVATLAAMIVAGNASAYTFRNRASGMWRCQSAIGWQVTGDVTPHQLVLLQRAVMRVSLASGQRYRFEGVENYWMPQMGDIENAPDNLVIAVVPRSASTLLQVDGMADWGFTWWMPSGKAAIAIMDKTPDYWFITLAMHELMLSRHIQEADDPGGLLGHRLLVRMETYPPQDVAMLNATGCL